MFFETVKNCQYIFYSHVSELEFIIGSLVLLALISWYLFRQVGGRAEIILTSVVIGGALGNILERIFTGCVTDYVNFFGLFHFNAWDLIITVGVLTLLTKSFIKEDNA